MMLTEMSLSKEKLSALESNLPGPCLSLYQETHRCSPDNKQDPLRHYLPSVNRFQILGLGLGKAHFFEGNRDALDEIAAEQGFHHAETVEKMGGRVVVIPEERLPGHSGLAAIFRY